MEKSKIKVKQQMAAFISIFFSCIVLSLVPSANAVPINLTLDQAIQRMTENNLTVKTLALAYEQAKLGYEVAWNTFYMPNFTFSSASTSAYSVGTLPNTPARNDPNAYKAMGYPTSTVALSLGSYTLFNFFRDRAAYDIAKLNFDRALSRYKEGVRSSKFTLTNLYFQTKTAQEKLEASERSMNISQAIADLINSRKKLGKATEDEENSASVDLLNAKVAYSAEKRNAEQISLSLNTALNAIPDTEFKLVTDPPFVPVKLDEKRLFDLFKTQSPQSKDAELNLTTTEMAASLSEKSRLPLPTLSFSGLSISYGNGYSGGASPNYISSTSANGVVEVSAVLSLTLPLFGPYGFFNEKLVKSAYIQRDIAEVFQKNSMMNGELNIRQKISTIKQLESQISTLKESLVKNSKILDNIFKKNSKSSMDRLQLRDALLQARQSELNYLDSLLSHISEKNSLSEFIGVDTLPGEKI